MVRKKRRYGARRRRAFSTMGFSRMGFSEWEQYARVVLGYNSEQVQSSWLGGAGGTAYGVF